LQLSSTYKQLILLGHKMAGDCARKLRPSSFLP
jgi:hypothetical protein